MITGIDSFRPLLQFAMQPCRGGVGIFGQQQRVAAAIDVGNVHSTVGADQAVTRFRDQHAALAPHHAPALRQRQFDDSGINFDIAAPKSANCREGFIWSSSTN